MAVTPKVLVERTGAPTDPIAVNQQDSRAVAQDHLLMIVKAVVNDTRVSALVDSGATRSFVSDNLKTRPLLDFVGAYSSLELANGETIVSTGIAPNVLVCIGSTVSRVSLTAVPMMAGVQLILGRDWLDEVNPLIDWRTNSLVLRCGNKLEVVQGICQEDKAPCKILDRGLSGLQCSFESLRRSPSKEEAYARLCSPMFWEPVHSAKSWVSMHSASPRASDAPQGEVLDQNDQNVDVPVPDKNDSPKQANTKGKRTRQVKVGGRCKTQPVKRKLEFISMRQAVKMANKPDRPMYLCVLKATQPPVAPIKKSKATVASKKGMTEGEKRRLSKETGPVKKDIPVDEVIKMKMQETDEDVREQLKEVLEEYKDVFPDKLPYGPPPRRIIDHEIETTPGVTPPHKSPYRLSVAEQDELKRQIDVLLEQGWIRPSISPYGAPVLFIPKKDGKWRMCIDYRALNKVTVKNRYPLPKVDELMDRLHGARYFTKIDLYSGYHQIKVKESDIHKTAFVSRYGSFEYTVMPFGLCNAPATFQRIMNHMLREGLDKFVLVFLDDILIYSRTKEEHVRHIRAVLDRLKADKMYGRLFKCDFFRTEVEYLGFDVGADGVKPCISKVRAILDWPTPESVSDIRSFLGLASFYRKFIRWFSEIAAPLTNLTKKNQSFVWTAMEDTAFNRLKKAMVTAPVLQLPDFEKEFTVTTDASGVSVGAILQQDFGSGLQPICYESRKLNPAETRYSAYERELLGIVWAVGKWRHYLANRHFTIQTDHDSLRHLPNQPSANRRMWKWVQVLQGYDCDLVHIPGKQNPADFLSRRSIMEVKDMVAVREEEESLIKRLQLHEGDDGDDAIQKKLDKIFAKSKPDLVDMVDQKESNSRASIMVARSRVTLSQDLRDSIKKGLTEDTKWVDIVNEIESAQRAITAGSREYRLYGGLLEMKDTTQQEGTRWRIVIPDVPEIKKQIMRESHEVPYAGHLGYHKTLQKIQRTFYWPEHTLEIRDFVMGCSVCQQEKAVHRVPAGLLQPLKLPEQKWADVSMDYIMGLPRSESGYDGILTVVDRATKMVHVLPVTQTITAAETARLYWDRIGRLHGMPRSIVSDRDPRFVSKFWRELWRVLGSTLRMSSAYHPQTDGQTEAMNRVVEMVLRCVLHADRDYSSWESVLPTVEFVINNSPSQATGYTPFYLNYGFHPCTPADLIRDHDATLVEGVTNFVDRMQRNFSTAVKFLNRAKDRMKEQSDRKRRELRFNTGEQVLLSTEHLNLKNAPVHKLRRRFVGPFFVVRRVGPVAYELELPETWKIHNVFHVSLLRPFRTSSWTQSVMEDQTEVDIEDDREYDVEKLLRWRWKGTSSRRRTKEFLVLWTGWSIDDASWTPAENFTSQEELRKMIERDRPVEDK